MSADPPQMETPLVAWRPAEERRRHTQPSHTSVFADTDAVSVKSHRDTAVGVPGVDEIFGHIKVFADNAGKHIVGFLVGRIRTPVGQCQHLPLRDGIGKQRRVMPLHDQAVACAVRHDMGLHTVAHQDVAHLRLQIHRPWVGILSYRHCLMIWIVCDRLSVSVFEGIFKFPVLEMDKLFRRRVSD